jgi:hypothetical protein
MSNGMMKDENNGLDKKDERSREEIVLYERIPLPTWECEEMGPFGRTHIICLSPIILHIFSSFVHIYGKNFPDGHGLRWSMDFGPGTYDGHVIRAF